MTVIKFDSLFSLLMKIYAQFQHPMQGQITIFVGETTHLAEDALRILTESGKYCSEHIHVAKFSDKIETDKDNVCTLQPEQSQKLIQLIEKYIGSNPHFIHEMFHNLFINQMILVTPVNHQ